jgi:acetyl esterase/lipase
MFRHCPLTRQPHLRCGLSSALVLTALLTGVGRAAPPTAAGLDFPIAERPSPDTYPERRLEFADGVVGLADVVYARKVHYRPLTLDLYLPARLATAGKSVPGIVHIHGGAWVSGTPRQNGAFADFPRVLSALAARGYVVASVEYRLDGEAKFPAAIDDVRDAIRFLRAHAGQYGLDSGRIAVWGSSAGGQLAALAAVACGDKAFVSTASAGSAPAAPQSAESPCVQGGVSWYGVHNFETVPTPPGGTGPAPYLGCVTPRCPKGTLVYASPTTYVDARDPPMLVIHGAADKLVAPAQSTELHERLLAAGVQSHLVMIPGVDHGLIGPDLAATRAASLKALGLTFDFFAQLYPPPD